MSELLNLRYQFDATGKSPDNLIIDEPHYVPQNAAGLIIPREGLIFTPGMVLRRASISTPLTQGEDFHFVSMDPLITAQTGIETASAIELASTDLYGDFIITYQAVGGYEGRSNRLVQDLIDAIEQAKNSPVEWENVRNKPALYPPAEHPTELETITGWEGLINKLHDLKQAIIDTHSLGSSALTLKEQDERILWLITEIRQDVGYLLNTYADVVTQIDRIKERLDKFQQFDVDFGEIGVSRDNMDYDVFLVKPVDLGEL